MLIRRLTAPFEQKRQATLYVTLIGYIAAHLLLWRLAEPVPTRAMVGWILCAGLALVLLRQQLWRYAASLLVGALMAESSLYLFDQWDALRGWMALWIAVTLATSLFSNRNGLGVTGGAGLLIVVATLNNIGGSEQQERLILSGMGIIWIVVLNRVVAWRVDAERHPRLQGPANISLQRLLAVENEITKGLFARQEIDIFLEQLVNTIQTQFGSRGHVQIYLVEPGSQQATLRAATGAVGQQLLSQEYGLDVGGLSVVGRVTLTGKMLLIADTHHEPIYKSNALMDDTRSELTLPLVANDEIIGALDIHSTKVNGFDDSDVLLLQVIANHLVSAVDGLRAYEMAQRNLRENQALYQQAQVSLREIERLNYQLTGRAWTEYLRLHGDATGFTLDVETGQTVEEADWTPNLNEAAQQQEMMTTTADGRRMVALPIMVRNEVIGAMEFELGSDDELPDGARELIVAVGQRLGMALENRRLFDETQRVAQREALINDIGAELQSATGVDAIIQRAARHLQEALEASQITIRIGTTVIQEKV
ncbi:MAG TPA: GAF domain-containing protein [Aggregatilineaceae bacterium]|nr:GAF domain-containing protein [Aggregatilineaceae bacterium]